MSHQAPLQPGDPRRVGRYRLSGRITGIPADGPIYVGSAADGSEVMISMVPGDWAHDGAARDRFAAEAAAAKRVPPFCAARVLDAGSDGDTAYLVSEYVPGESLLEIVSTRGVLPEGEIEAVAIGMATGLASVHQAGLVHGSFGPEFAIMTAAGPRVVEFAITPPYGIATPSADMVAWAQTVVFAATGRPPATMADLEVLPYYVRDLVAACLNPDPSERPTARAAVQELLGDHDPPAGVLAEGSRRAAPGTGIARHLMPPAAGGAPQARPGPPASQSPRVPLAASRRERQAGQAPGFPAAVPDRPGGHHQQPRRKRRLVPVIAVSAVVCAAIVIGAVQLLGGGTGTPQARSPGTRATPDGVERSPLTTQSSTPDVTTPAVFAGHWSGQLRQPPNDTISVSLRLTKGASTGSVRYSPAGIPACTAALSLTRATARILILSQSAIEGQNCPAGTVTITLTGGNNIHYLFQGHGPAASGTLTRV